MKKIAIVFFLLVFNSCVVFADESTVSIKMEDTVILTISQAGLDEIGNVWAAPGLSDEEKQASAIQNIMAMINKRVLMYRERNAVKAAKESIDTTPVVTIPEEE